MRKKNDLRKSGASNVFKGMLTLAAGAGAARIIGFASIPIVTRIYSPTDYGILALYASAITILTPFATLKYTTAIPLPKNDRMAINLLILSLILVGLVCFVISIPLFLFGDVVLSWFNMKELANWWWLIVLGVAGSAIYEIFSLWSTRKRKYRAIAISQFTQSITGNSVKIILGLLAFKPFGLIFGQFLAQSSGVGTLIKSSVQDYIKNKNSINLARIRLVAFYYRKFAYFRLPSQFLMALSVQAPVLIMAALYGKEVTGQLSLAIIAISLPAGLIGSVMSQAFYSEIALLGRHNMAKIRMITIEVQKKLFLVGIPCSLMIMLFAESIFSIVFGKEWSTAGRFASILAPFVLLQLTSAPLVQVLNITGSQITFLIINILRISGLGLIFFIFSNVDADEIGLVKAVSAFLSVFYLSITALIFYYVNSGVKIKNAE